MTTDNDNSNAQVPDEESVFSEIKDALESDGPGGPGLVLLVHNDGRVTLKSSYDPQTVAGWLNEFAMNLIAQYPNNQWPGSTVPVLAPDAESESGS